MRISRSIANMPSRMFCLHGKRVFRECPNWRVDLKIQKFGKWSLSLSFARRISRIYWKFHKKVQFSLTNRRQRRNSLKLPQNSSLWCRLKKPGRCHNQRERLHPTGWWDPPSNLSSRLQLGPDYLLWSSIPRSLPPTIAMWRDPCAICLYGEDRESSLGDPFASQSHRESMLYHCCSRVWDS